MIKKDFTWYSMGDRKNLCHDFPWNTNDRSGNGNLLWIIYSIRN